jgi:type III pantothenate kinase
VLDVLSEAYAPDSPIDDIMSAVTRLASPSRILISSVLGDDFNQALARSARSIFGVQAEFVSPTRLGYGIRVGYLNPEEFGADRFVALVAARARFKQNCIVVGCGTAVTIDGITKDGEHLGGLILPGLDLMRRSLVEHTARIDVKFDNEVPLFGHTTSQAVSGGTSRGLAGAIDRIVEEMLAYMHEHCGCSPVMRLMSGGASGRLLPYLAAAYHFEESLVLQGLAVIAELRATLD